ncbi:hypothetical protein PUMCH_002647 [Australozyma saopauloensis]|uniref:Glycosyltransferase 2-like domain-containing protein n=1 Tax=Australozyma saopauloensis TaxID=291208 RepID=A0AAX4HAB7_9ASCO|nr:hypothetical protein PUMCH_002647 [[Candida] saopauloensis]
MANRCQYGDYRFNNKYGVNLGDYYWSQLVRNLEEERKKRKGVIPYGFQLDHYPEETWCNKWQEIFDLASEGLDSDSMKCFQGHRLGIQGAVISDFNTFRSAHASHIASLSRMEKGWVEGWVVGETMKGQPVEWAHAIEKYNEAFNEMKPKIDANIDSVEDASAKAALKIAFGQIKLYHIHWCEQTTWYYKSYLQPVWAILHIAKKTFLKRVILGYSYIFSKVFFIGAIGALIGLPNRAKLFKVPFSEAKGIHISFIIMMVPLCVYILLLLLSWKFFQGASKEEKLYLAGQLAELVDENWNYRVFSSIPATHKFSSL